MQYASSDFDATADQITSHLFRVMPLLKRRVALLSAVQTECGMPQSHVQVLAMLDEVESMSVSEISHRFGIAKPNITPLVDRLVSLGYVDRVRSVTDRRVVNVVILPKGRAKLGDIQSAMRARVQDWADAMDEQDFAELEQSLDRVVKILSKS